MQTTPKANNILGHFFALLGAVVLLAIATWVSASSSEQVQPLDNLATPRTGHTATGLSDGRILITGGRDHDGNLVAASEIFDPETQTSSASGTLHTARIDHSATVLVDGRVLIAGGSNNSGPLSSAEIFDPINPAAGFQVVASPMTAARTHHTATLLNNGNVLIAGGETAGTAEIFDPTTQSFTPTLWNLSVARSGHTATLFTDDSVLLAGGNTASMEMYTPLDQKFTLDAAMLSVVRTGHWAFELSDTRLLLFQGDTGNSIDEFNPTNDTITPKGSLDFHASSSTLLANGKVLVLGTDVSGLYNPDAVPPAPDFTAFDEATVPHSGILPRSGQSAVTLPGDKQILITGGVDGNNRLLGQALFNPARIWTDKDDYVPDEPVILSGSGWKANEPVHLFAVDNETEQWTYEMTVPADANGGFVLDPYFIVELRHLGVRFHVTAVGQSTMQADVYFTDDTNITTATIAIDESTCTTPTITFTQGQTVCSKVVVTGVGGGGGTGSFFINWVRPGGTLDHSTTEAVPPAAPATFTDTFATNGTTPTGLWTVQVCRTAACSGGNLVTSASFTLNGTVGTTLVLNSVSPNSVTYGSAGPVTFTATLTRTTGGAAVSGATVNFTVDGGAAGSGVTNGSGVATFTTYNPSALSVASHNVQASFTAATISGVSYVGSTSGTLPLAVTKATPTITWANPADITYGTALGGTQLNATASVPGSFVYTPAAGTVLNAGAGQTLHVAFTPTDTANYNGASADVTMNVLKATPTINWSNPADITYGTALSSTQLNATATFNSNPVPGAFTYTPPSGTVLLAGNSQALSASFTPTDTTNFNSVPNTTVHINVTKAHLTVTAQDANRGYGDPNPTFTASYSGFKNGETLATSGVTGSPSLTTTATATSAASPPTYTITAALGTLTAGNYDFTFVNGHLTIDKATLTVTAQDANRGYGDPNPTFTASYGGFKNGETLATSGVTGSPSLTTTATATSAASPPTYPITAALGTLAAGNYDFTFVNGHLTIDKATLTVTAQDANRGYGDPNPTFTASYSGFKNGETLATSGVTGSPSLTTTATATSAASPPTYTITATIGTLTAGNYDFTFVNGHLTIDKATLTVTAQDANRGYGDPNPTFTASYGGFKNGETLASSGVTGSPSLTTTATAISPASPPTYTITAALGTLSAGNYDFTFVNGHLTIDKATLTVTAQDANRGYGDPNPTFTAGYSGFKNGETLATSGVTGSPSLTTTATAASAASPPTYLITAALGTLTAGNYDFTFVNGHLTIDKATLTVTANDASRGYGDPNPTFTASYSGFKNGETLATSGVTGSPSLTTTATATSAVPGPYAIMAALGTLAAGNYDFTFADGELTITKATLTVTAQDASRGYGDPNPTFTASYSGFKNGETLATSGVTGSPSLTTTATAASAVPGPYAIMAALGTLAAGNYDFTFANGELTITKATLTVTANDASRGYGDPNPTFTASYSGFKNGETLVTSGVTGSPSLTTTATATSAVPGPYAIMAALGTLAAGNYDFTFADGELTITKATLTVTAQDASRGYGDPNPTFTASYSGFKNGETLATSGVTGSPSLTTTATAASAASPPTYLITAALGTLTAGNYDFTFVNGHLTIDKATLTVTAQDANRGYGDPNPTFTAGYSGFKNGETLATSGVTGSPSLTTTATATSAVPGPYAIMAALGTLAAGNYDFTFADGQLTIIKAHLTVTADDKSRTYGAANPTFTASYSGFKNGETLATSGVSGTPSFSGTGPASTATTTVGNYVITPAVGALSATNYDFTFFVDATLHITQAHLTVTADDKSRTYGAANPTFTATITGFVNGETVAVVSGSPTISGTGPSSTATTTVGNYVITPALGTLSATNYDFTPFVNGMLTITKVHLTVTADDKSRAYGAANPTFTATITGFVNGETVAVVSGSPTISGTGPSSTATTTVGNYVITPALGTLSATNYDFTPFVNGMLTITKVHLTVTADNKSRAYGAANPIFTATITGFVNGETVAVVSGSPTISGTGPSSTATTTVGNYVITPALGTLSATNYDFTPFANGTLTIIKVHLTVTADNKSKAYNGSPFTAFTVTITGFVNGETVAVVSGSATYTGTAVGATLPGTYTITPQQGTLSATNYDFPGPSPGTYFVNGTLTIGYGTCTGSDPGGVILPPINNDGSSVYKRKAGSTIPVKFKVCDANGNSISDPNVVFQTGCCGSVNMTSRMRGTVESVNEAGETSIPDVAFRYTGDHWQFNMDSGNLDAGYTYTFVITLKYGSIQFMLATK